MLRSIWKLIKILVVFLIIFGIVSMIVSLIITFTVSSKMATELSKLFCSTQKSEQQHNQLSDSTTIPKTKLLAYGAGSFLAHQDG